MSRTGFVGRFPPPLLTATLALIVVAVVAFWGGASRTASAPTFAQIAKTHAALRDGECDFAADVRLRDRWAGLAFSFRQGAVRSALVDLLRSKSRYMVSSGPAREALRDQMLAAVNGVIGDGRATEIHFTAFELS